MSDKIRLLELTGTPYEIGYAHGKAYVFLNALRDTVGVPAFDAAVNELLDVSATQAIGYDALVERLARSDLGAIDELERRFEVGERR